MFSFSVPLASHTRSTSALSEKLEALTDRNRASRRRKLHETEIDNKLGCLECQLERGQLYHRNLRQDLALEWPRAALFSQFPCVMAQHQACPDFQRLTRTFLTFVQVGMVLRPKAIHGRRFTAGTAQIQCRHKTWVGSGSQPCYGRPKTMRKCVKWSKNF